MSHVILSTILVALVTTSCAPAALEADPPVAAQLTPELTELLLNAGSATPFISSWRGPGRYGEIDHQSLVHRGAPLTSPQLRHLKEIIASAGSYDFQPTDRMVVFASAVAFRFTAGSDALWVLVSERFNVLRFAHGDLIRTVTCGPAGKELARLASELFPGEEAYRSYAE